MKTVAFTKSSVREIALSPSERPRQYYKESAACPITKASDSSHFHIPLAFCPVLLSQPCSIRGFFSFSHVRNFKKCVRRRVTIPQGQEHVRSAQQCLALFADINTWMDDQLPIPRVARTFFLIFFPLLFRKAILRTAELPFLYNVVSSIYQLFVPHFTMAVFLCICLHYRINKQRGTSFEFSSILSTVDLSKHLIRLESFENSYSSSIL